MHSEQDETLRHLYNWKLQLPEACMLTDPGACPLDVEYADGDRHCTKCCPHRLASLLQGESFAL